MFALGFLVGALSAALLAHAGIVWAKLSWRDTGHPGTPATGPVMFRREKLKRKPKIVTDQRAWELEQAGKGGLDDLL